MDQPITIGKQLRKQYFQSEYTDQNNSLDEYIDLLKKQGVYINPHLLPAYFKIRNGLQYPGIATLQDIKGFQLLALIPKHLLLSTRVCLKQPLLQTTYKDKFFLSSIYWEHRVLITYLLWTFHRKQGIWYHMVVNLSRDVDFICLWEDEEARWLGDDYAFTASRNDKKIFEAEVAEWRKVLLQTKAIPEELLTRDNYKWLYAHLFSRCFGRLQSITMVPFCEFFNHHISRVFYDFEYKQGNPHKHLETRYDKKDGKVPDDDDLSSSNESDRSYDYDEDIEKEYAAMELRCNNWEVREAEDLNQKATKVLEKAFEDLNWQFVKSIDWTDGSALYIAQLLEHGLMTIKQYKAGRMKPQIAIKAIEDMKKDSHNYRQLIIKFYQGFRSARFQYTVHNNNAEQREPEYRKSFPAFQGDKFDSFSMRLGRKDYFRKDNQVYFRYGRLSNRKMLECYGMAIQGNKYDHFWVRINGLQYLAGYPDMIEKMQSRRLTLKFKFKIKRREFSLQLVLFFRLTNWSRMRQNVQQIFAPKDVDSQIKVITSYYNILKQFESKSEKQSILVDQLKSKQTGYHKYFAIIYRLQHVRILTLHLRLVQLALRILTKIKSGQSLAQATKHDRSEATEFWMLRNYISTLDQLK